MFVLQSQFRAKQNKFLDRSWSIITSSSAVADKPARRAACTTNGKILKQSRDHNHARVA